jgi:hypothetical protein
LTDSDIQRDQSIAKAPGKVPTVTKQAVEASTEITYMAILKSILATGLLLRSETEAT